MTGHGRSWFRRNGRRGPWDTQLAVERHDAEVPSWPSYMGLGGDTRPLPYIRQPQNHL
jgi:hypothetical protein